MARWLKAGYVEFGQLHETTEGTPQGGVISPLLANVALDGLQAVLFSIKRRKGGLSTGKRVLGYSRYADDFIVTAPTRDLLDQALPLICDWLAKRGLALNEEKTRIVHIADGFNFLGFHVRSFKGHVKVQPEKAKVLAKLREVRSWLKQHSGTSPRAVVRYLNSTLPNWAEYYRHVSSSRVYAYFDHRLFRMLWSWARRRHTKRKNMRWVRRRYFDSVGGRKWVFTGQAQDRRGHWTKVHLTRVYKTFLPHYVVTGANSPMDPTLRTYWHRRHLTAGFQRYDGTSLRAKVFRRQQGRCAVCRGILLNGESFDEHHKVTVKRGGNDSLANLELRHEACHYNSHHWNDSIAMQHEPDEGMTFKSGSWGGGVP